MIYIACKTNKAKMPKPIPPIQSVTFLKPGNSTANVSTTDANIHITAKSP